MMKRFVLMFVATAVLAVPASSAFAAPPRTNGALPGELCFRLYPQPVQPMLCGTPGHGDLGGPPG